jgi:hypothetical protein
MTQSLWAMSMYCRGTSSKSDPNTALLVFVVFYLLVVFHSTNDAGNGLRKSSTQASGLTLYAYGTPATPRLCKYVASSMPSHMYFIVLASTLLQTGVCHMHTQQHAIAACIIRRSKHMHTTANWSMPQHAPTSHQAHNCSPKYAALFFILS